MLLAAQEYSNQAKTLCGWGVDDVSSLCCRGALSVYTTHYCFRICEKHSCHLPFTALSFSQVDWKSFLGSDRLLCSNLANSKNYRLFQSVSMTLARGWNKTNQKQVPFSQYLPDNLTTIVFSRPSERWKWRWLLTESVLLSGQSIKSSADLRKTHQMGRLSNVNMGVRRDGSRVVLRIKSSLLCL